MKLCPDCRRVYDDETWRNCLDDGASLVYGQPAMDEPSIALLYSFGLCSEIGTKAENPLTDRTDVFSDETRRKFRNSRAETWPCLWEGFQGTRNTLFNGQSEPLFDLLRSVPRFR